MARRDFFESTVDPDVLRINASSSDKSLRWAAAVELGEVHQEWSVEILWTLKDDTDEHVRSVALKALSLFDKTLVERVVFETVAYEEPERSSNTMGNLAPHVAWKTRPLDEPDDRNEWAVSAAVIDIINTEGPLTGARLYRLYAESVFPNSPKRLKKVRIYRAVQGLIHRGIVSLADGQDSQYLDDWTLHRTGGPAVIVRERGQRRFSEIPSSEVSQLLTQGKIQGPRPRNRNRDFEEILRLYSVKPSDYHLIAGVIDKEWRGLF
jgi:hypothetical protein